MTKLDDFHDKLLSSIQKQARLDRQAQRHAVSTIPSQAEYESNERRMAHKRVMEIEKSPLADRKEAAVEFLDAMKNNPGMVAERLEWLIDGNYGYGVMMLAKEIVARPRMNRPAALTQMIAVHEWMCPQAMAIAAWKKLSSTEKARLDKAVEAVIRNAERGEE